MHPLESCSCPDARARSGADVLFLKVPASKAPSVETPFSDMSCADVLPADKPFTVAPRASAPVARAPRPVRLTQLVLVPLLIALAGCSDPETDSETIAERAEPGGVVSRELVQRYQESADQLLRLLDDDDNADHVEPMAQALVDQSLPLLDSVMLRYTECTDYLQQAITLAQHLPQLDQASLDRDYREGRGLPDAPPRCRDAAEILTEPAAAVIAASTQPPQWRSDVRTYIRTAQARLDQLQGVFSEGW
ncbi:hypothetical protein [Alcanivorax quisquiliarum]|uniref:Uncharacterized protein n=1 Tax=Alcanivorax quisquiliarum TaxID=2933565 RepID=A0ABT0E9I9_9GAMM|nr:hypothetical protein [Alcanivorax quisquiliarum]MCK0538425.1 hypothetical protein [Alcanivorax quisquiliarum]